MKLYFKLKAFFKFFLPMIAFAIIIIIIVVLSTYETLHYKFVDKKKYELLETNGYKHEVERVAGVGNGVWYHLVKEEPKRSTLKDESLKNMKYKDLKIWIKKELQ